MKQTIFALLVSSAAIAAGCSNDAACVADDDCFKGEVCVEDVCERESDNNTNNGPSSNQTTQSNATNNGTVGENNPTGNNSNSSTNNMTNGGTNNPTHNGTNNTSGACRGSTFESCPPDDDVATPTMLTGPFGRGCVMPDDGFEGGDISADATICPLEGSDRFSVGVNPCQTTNFFIDVDVVPRELCPPGSWDLDVSLNGNNCVEDNGLVTCGDGDTAGSKRASLVVEPSSSVAVLYIDVVPSEDNVLFEYDVIITFRQ